MKPSFTPWVFSNLSLYRLRRFITGAMFTSLKVVRMAAVDCDCTRRSATRARSRDIGTRCSARAEAGMETAGAAAGLAAACRSRCRRSANLDDHVFLRDTAAATGTGDVGGVHARFGGDLCCSGGGPCFHFCRRRRCRCCGGRSGWRGTRLCRGIQQCNHFTGAYRSTVALDDFHQHAIGGRGQFHHHLVGFDVDQVLIALDRLPFLLVPGHQGRFGYGFGELRHFDFDLHGDFLRLVFFALFQRRKAGIRL